MSVRNEESCKKGERREKNVICQCGMRRRVKKGTGGKKSDISVRNEKACEKSDREKKQ